MRPAGLRRLLDRQDRADLLPVDQGARRLLLRHRRGRAAGAARHRAFAGRPGAARFSVSKESIELADLVDFDRYFAAELRDLEALAADGLVEMDGDWINVTAAGRLLVRAVCMVFDKYLRAAQQRAQYSRVM